MLWINPPSLARMPQMEATALEALMLVKGFAFINHIPLLLLALFIGSWAMFRFFAEPFSLTPDHNSHVDRK
jgi:hypothetical protein